MRIRNSFDIAHEKGLKFSFTPNEQETDIHPNTVDICMENEKGQKMSRTRRIPGRRQGPYCRYQSRTGRLYRRVQCSDRDSSGQPGVVAYITKCLSDRNIDLAFMRLFRESKGEIAYTIVESDGKLP